MISNMICLLAHLVYGAGFQTVGPFHTDPINNNNGVMVFNYGPGAGSVNSNQGAVFSNSPGAGSVNSNNNGDVFNYGPGAGAVNSNNGGSGHDAVIGNVVVGGSFISMGRCDQTCKVLASDKGAALSAEPFTALSLLEKGFAGGDFNVNYNGKEGGNGEISYEIKSDIADLKNKITVTHLMQPTGMQVLINSPQSYSGNLKYQVTVNISLPSILMLDTLTGSITSSSLTVAGPAKLKSFSAMATSGDINLSSLSCQDLKLDVTSGNVNAKAITATKVNTQITSGNADVEFNSPAVSLDTTSGNIKAKVTGYKTLNAQTTSGDCSLDLVPKAGSKTTLDTTTGSMKASFKGFAGSYTGFSSVQGAGVELSSKGRLEKRKSRRKNFEDDDDEEDKPKSGTVGQGDMQASCNFTNGDCQGVFN